MSRKVLAFTVGIPFHSDSGRTTGRLVALGKALGLFASWFAVVFGVALLYARTSGDAGAHAGEMEGIGLLMGLMGGGLLGDWFFARAIAAALEMEGSTPEVVLTGLWVVLPLALAWRWRRRRRA